MASNLMTTVISEIKDCMKTLLEECTLEPELQDAIILWLSACLYTAAKSAQEEMDCLCREIGFVWTMNPVYLQYVGQSYTDCTTAMAKSLVNLSNDGTSFSRRETEVKTWLANNRDVDAALDVFARLDAYYSISRARFTDNVGIQVVERHLLGLKSPLKMFQPIHINKMADEEPEKLKSIAGEREDKEIERKEINDEKRSLEEALRTARAYGYHRRVTVGH